MANITSKDIVDTRAALSMTQDELAKVLSVTRRTIQNWEQGENIPSPKQAIIAKKLRELLEQSGRASVLPSETYETIPVHRGIIEIMLNQTVSINEKDKQMGELISIIKHFIGYERKAVIQNP